ncbi:MAG: DinB family protein [Ignavibacteriales bacterium]
MLENAIKACPEELWGDRTQKPEYWYLIYHTLFWLDFYLTDSPDNYDPPKPFTLSELDPEGLFPKIVYTRVDLLNYLEHGRNKCKQTIKNLTDEKVNKHYEYGTVEMSFSELLLYNMRHVQHGVGQLNLILRQKTNSAPGWVKQIK